MFCTAKAAGGHGRCADVPLLDCIYCPAHTKQREHFILRGVSLVESLRQAPVSAQSASLCIRHKNPFIWQNVSLKCFTRIPFNPQRPTGASHKYSVLDDKNEGWGEAASVQMKTTPCKESANSALISQKLLKKKKKKQNLIVKLKSGQFPICVFIAACVCTITALYTSVYQLFSTALHPARLRYLWKDINRLSF